MTRTVGILIFDGIEVLDLGGPFEVLSVATRLAGRDGEAAPFQPVLIGASGAPAVGRGGFRVLPHATLDDHPPLHVLIVPGGVMDAPLADPHVRAWVRAQAARVEVLASICTGAFLLASEGLLDGLRVTTHWEDQADLQAQFPALTVVPDVAWVDAGAVVTSGGISAGIDMTLHLVGRLHSHALAERTARQMEFRWTGQGLLDGATP
ncbi:DJ-1/PfpI family protein [Deinococcus kurensis]|uniref:DJ-1/PfpI family protein n=1 Tax=Deinococcus kurensis TaxID=2662757 RepID=UPI0012D3491C|nr:DJ-1/PfpI family protein [Deinococcus kurensis]